MPRKEITVFVFGNYTTNSLRFSLPLHLARLLFALLILILLIVFAAIGIVASGAWRFSRLVYLNHRNRQLEQEFKKVSQLKERLEFLEAEREKLAKMLGVELTPPPVDWGGVVTESLTLPEWAKNQPWGSQGIPVLVPVSGYVVSRAFSADHPGVDLAAQKGGPVYATADGVVLARGTDKQFGRYILLGHPQNYASYYGHLDAWKVASGDTVRVGTVIGTVGTSGQTSAPHLHLEIRKDGKPIDPAQLLRF